MLLEGRLGLGNHAREAWGHCMAEAGAVGGGWNGLDFSRRHSRQVTGSPPPARHPAAALKSEKGKITK